MSLKYSLFGTTADVGVRSSGRDLAGAFENQAAGMFSVMVDMRGVRAREKFHVEASGEGDTGLLAAWLEELLFISDTRGVFLRRFAISSIRGGRLVGDAYGEKIDPGRHVVKTLVKAVTYHMMEVKRTGGGVTTTVLYDI